MEFQQSVAFRTRARRPLHEAEVLALESKRKKRKRINETESTSTKSKRITGTDTATGLGASSRQKRETTVIVIDEEEYDEEDYNSMAANCVAGRTRSRRHVGALPKSRTRTRHGVALPKSRTISIARVSSKEPRVLPKSRTRSSAGFGSKEPKALPKPRISSSAGVASKEPAFVDLDGSQCFPSQSSSCFKDYGDTCNSTCAIADNGDDGDHDDSDASARNDGEESGSCSSGIKKRRVSDDNETDSLGRANSRNSGLVPADSRNSGLVPAYSKNSGLVPADTKNSSIAKRTHLRRLRKINLKTFAEPSVVDLDEDCPQSASVPVAANFNDFLDDESSSEDGRNHVIHDGVVDIDDSHEECLVSKGRGDHDADYGDDSGDNYKECAVVEDGEDYDMYGDDVEDECDDTDNDSDEDYAVGKDGGDNEVDDADGGDNEIDDADGEDNEIDDADGGVENLDRNKEGEEVQFGKSTKRKHVHVLKENNLFKLILDTIWSEKELPNESSPEVKIPTKSVEEPKSLNQFPLKFSWGDHKVPEVEEKTEEEKFIEKLWIEFDFVMKSRDLGCFSTKVDDDGRSRPEFESDRFNFCHKEDHQFILDEEIGIKCILCPFVKLEIRDILPPMVNSWGKKSRYGPVADADSSVFHKLNCQDIDDDSQCYVPSEGTVWDIIPGVKRTMYQHQQEGFEFIWKNLAGSIKLEQLKESINPDELGGCVISHAPGTGKTRLAIVFIQTFMEMFPRCRPIILAPSSMLLTWEKEFSKWKVDIPIHLLKERVLSGKEDKVTLQWCHKEFKDRKELKDWVRWVKILSWIKGKSILGLTYNLFEKLVRKSIKHDDNGEIGKILTEKTGLLVLDEGHTPRNARSLIWKALNKVKTNRRIILSGTPFQNNLVELFNTLCLVRPQFAKNFTAKNGYICQRRSEIPSDNAQKVLLERRYGREKGAPQTNSTEKSLDANLEQLRSLMDPFVHVYKGCILNNLPGLRDCILVLHPSHLQKKILETLTNLNFGNNFHQEFCTSLISIHPSLLLKCNIFQKECISIEKNQLESLRLNPDEGVKTRFVMELIRLSCAMNEKVLIFSQYIDPLTLLQDHLKHLFDWTEGKEVLQINGDITDVNRRQSCIDCFNDPKSEARVLLASTRACGEGINLIGASRVVLLDVVWNPSVERQAISRAYRIGQQKVVYTYHLLTSGTREGDKYYRQAEKDRLSELLFSSTDGDTYKQCDSSKISKDKILEEMVEHAKLKTMFEKILHQPRKSSILDSLGHSAFR